jgi:gliding motility-associated-like protein
MFGLRIKLMAFCLLFVANGVAGQYDSVRYDMTTQNVHWNSLSDYNAKGFNPDTLSKPLYCQSETTPTFIVNYSKTNDYNSNVAKSTNVLDAGPHYGVAGVYTKRHYDLTTHAVRVKGAFVCRTTTTGELNEYWIGGIPVANTNYHSAIYGGGNAPVGYIVGAWVDWWCARTRGSTSQPDKFFETRVNANMPLGMFFEAMAEFRIIHDSVVMTKYTLTPPVDDRYKQQSWVYPVYRSIPFEPFKDASWFKDFRPAFMPDDGLDWVEVVAEPLSCSMELKKKSISVCEGESKPLDLSALIWLKNQSIDNKTGVFYLRKCSNPKSSSLLHKSLTNALLPSNLPFGDYTVSYISPCGDSIQFTVKVSAKPEVVLTDTAMCKGTKFKPNAKINASAAINRYIWRCGSNNQGSTPQPIWSMLDTGKLLLTLHVEDNNGCQGSDTAIVYVSTLGKVSVGFNDSNQCFVGHSFNLSANCLSNSQNQYKWRLPQNPVHTTQSINGVKFGSPGTYRVELFISNPWGCSDSAALDLEVYESPVVDVYDTQVCENQSFSVRYFDKPSTANGLKHRWLFNNTDSIKWNSPIYSASQNGKYTLQLILENYYGCSDTDDALVTIHPNPKLNYDFWYLDEMAGATRWTYNYTGTLGHKIDWFQNGQIIASGSGPGIVVIDDLGLQRFKLRVISDKGCQDSLEFSKMIAASNNLYYPNAFTPDGQGGNNVFGPYNAELLENYRLIVFNRWGEKLYESGPNQYYWDGRDSKGEPVMEGQYIYMVSGIKNTGQSVSRSGTVYLYRNH